MEETIGSSNEGQLDRIILGVEENNDGEQARPRSMASAERWQPAGDFCPPLTWLGSIPLLHLLTPVFFFTSHM